MALTVAVIGNCQVGSLVRCLKALAPDAKIVAIALVAAVRENRTEAAAAVAVGCDILLSQAFDRPSLGRLNTSALAGRRPDLVIYPRVVFTGFHPDIAYVFDGGRAVSSPMGDYHSEILLGAFLCGLPLETAVGLFRPQAYRALGYFREYRRSVRRFLADGEAIGFDFAAMPDAWLKDGAFMHTLNHPKLRVLAEIARLALARAGVETAEADIGAIEDPLAAWPRWPVYPEVAQRLGVEGSMAFVRAKRDGGEVMDLPAFAAACYGLYAGLPRETLTRRVRRDTLGVLAGLA